MSELDFTSYEKLSNTLTSSLKLPANELTGLKENLSALYKHLEKCKEYTSVIGFMRSTGQGSKADSIEFALEASSNAFSIQKDKILSFFKSNKFTDLTLRKLGKTNFSLEEKDNAILSGKKLKKLFKKSLTKPKINSPENKLKVYAMQEKFKVDYKERLDSIAKFLPLQTANLFVDLMLQYEKIELQNISDQEKLAKSRIIDERLAEIGCINLKYLVINDRNNMVSDMLNANFTGDIKQAVQEAYSSFYVSPMENDNYRNASILTETLKINYLKSKGLDDEYGNKALEEIDFVAQTKTMERYVFTPSPADTGLIDEETAEIFNGINLGLNGIYESVFPTNPNPEENTTEQKNTPVLSEDLINNTVKCLTLIDTLNNIPEDKKAELQTSLVEQTAKDINEKLSKSSDNADRFKANLQNKELSETFIHEDDNTLREITAKTNINDPKNHTTKEVFTEILDFDVKDKDGNNITYITAIQTIESTKFSQMEEALVFENLPTTYNIGARNPITKEDVEIEIDENGMIVSISGDNTIATQLHDQFIKTAPEELQQAYADACLAKEANETEANETEVKQKEQEQYTPEEQKVDDVIAQALDEENPNLNNTTPTQEEIYNKRAEMEAENEDVMVMTPKGHK